MKPGDSDDMNPAELIETFRDMALQAGSPATIKQAPEKLHRTPERAARVANLKKVSTLLRTRASADDIRRLMLDRDVDVRFWASAQFLSSDPELASAVQLSLIKGVPVDEILELRRRATITPDETPALGELSDEQVVARFDDAAIREFGARFIVDDREPTDRTIENRIVNQIIDAREELRRRGALKDLVPLLDSRYITVRLSAAIATLTVAPERAVATLEGIVAGNDPFLSGQASRALERFRNGDFGKA